MLGLEDISNDSLIMMVESPFLMHEQGGEGQANHGLMPSCRSLLRMMVHHINSPLVWTPTTMTENGRAPTAASIALLYDQLTIQIDPLSNWQ